MQFLYQNAFGITRETTIPQCWIGEVRVKLLKKPPVCLICTLFLCLCVLVGLFTYFILEYDLGAALIVMSVLFSMLSIAVFFFIWVYLVRGCFIEYRAESLSVGTNFYKYNLIDHVTTVATTRDRQGNVTKTDVVRAIAPELQLAEDKPADIILPRVWGGHMPPYCSERDVGQQWTGAYPPRVNARADAPALNARDFHGAPPLHEFHPVLSNHRVVPMEHSRLPPHIAKQMVDMRFASNRQVDLVDTIVSYEIGMVHSRVLMYGFIPFNRSHEVLISPLIVREILAHFSYEPKSIRDNAHTFLLRSNYYNIPASIIDRVRVDSVLVAELLAIQHVQERMGVLNHLNSYVGPTSIPVM